MRKIITALVAVWVFLLSGCGGSAHAIPLPTQAVENAVIINYGMSGSGCYDLTAYRFGDGENVLLLTFAIHGWEDSFPQDGEALMHLGNQVVSYLDGHPNLLEEGAWSVYVIPCVNPDGLCLGSTCNGEGRCTVYSDSDKGVDINRSFPYAFVPLSDSRNYNGDSPLACVEARALAELSASIMGTGKNLCVDTHGWYAQVLSMNMGSLLHDAFLNAFPQNTVGSLAHGNGYFSAWCGYVLGYDDVCLLELPSGIYSLRDFEKSGITGAYLSALEVILCEG